MHNENKIDYYYIVYSYSNQLKQIMKNYRVLLFVACLSTSQSFLGKGPLRKLVLSKAVQSSLTEALAVNVFDVSAIVHEISCDCKEHPYLPVYFGGFVLFSYLYIINERNDKLKNVEFYSNVKRNLRMILFILFVVFGKNVDNAI